MVILVAASAYLVRPGACPHEDERLQVHVEIGGVVFLLPCAVVRMLGQHFIYRFLVGIRQFPVRKGSDDHVTG